MENRGVTNGREILGYAVAQAIRIGALYVVNYSGLLLPIYTWAFHSGVMLAIYGVTVSTSTVWGAVGLLLFIALRGGFGGTPAFVAGGKGRYAVRSITAEIGAFVGAYALCLIAFIALNVAFLAPVYRSLAQGGQKALGLELSLTVSIVNTAIVFVLFIALRWAFSARLREAAA